MKKFSLTVLACVVSLTIVFGQNTTQKEEVKYKHSIGASVLMLYNFFEDPADYYLLTYGHQLTKKDRVFVEYNTWKYGEPMGSYGHSEELYPGFIRTHGIGIGYQRFHWKGLFTTGQATNFLKQYYDENDAKFQKGYQLYLQLAVGYRLEFFKKRFYIEPAGALKYWPIDTNIPSNFATIAEGTPKTIIEPSLNIGYKF